MKDCFWNMSEQWRIVSGTCHISVLLPSCTQHAQRLLHRSLKMPPLYDVILVVAGVLWLLVVDGFPFIHSSQCQKLFIPIWVFWPLSFSLSLSLSLTHTHTHSYSNILHGHLKMTQFLNPILHWTHAAQTYSLAFSNNFLIQLHANTFTFRWPFLHNQSLPQAHVVTTLEWTWTRTRTWTRKLYFPRIVV